jgi:two-component sensor histidine kinase
VPTLGDLVRENTQLDEADVDWLHQLVGDWQMLSDLSFADLVLWVRDQDDGWVAVAHCRPSTGATVYYDDVVGTRMPPGRRVDLERAAGVRRIFREQEPEWHDDVAVRREAIPVVRAGSVLGVISRSTNLATARTPSRLELTYLHCADDLAQMVAAGTFPVADAATGPRRGAPRVGDGLFRIDREGRIGYASPNAVSALHRLGYLGEAVGHSLTEIVTPLLDAVEPAEESLALVLGSRVAGRSDIESRGATLSIRAIPVVVEGEGCGGLVLVRDVSELRRRERELLTKEATIREVHHRVKNNLQTVAALLRLQARRIPSAEGRLALEEAMRRVTTIALVHETLSQGLGETVDFDDVVARAAALAVELSTHRGPVTVERIGAFGTMRAENATPLALVLTELVTNAVEHGLRERGGRVTITAERDGEALRVSVRDDGDGLPEDFEPGVSGLGSQIVQALVGGDMRGRIAWERPPSGGTEALVEVTVRPVPGQETPAGGLEQPAVSGRSR